MLQSLLGKAVWFLKLYFMEYRYLLIFLAIFVLLYTLFMHWLNIHFLKQTRRLAAVVCLGIEIAAIMNFTILFREVGTSSSFELEMFWSYKRWLLEGSVELGMEIINNILLFFPFGFILTDVFGKCPLRAVIFLAGVSSTMIEVSQLVFKIGLFEFDDIFNNVIGALLGWCVFHALRSFRYKRKEKTNKI